jgi:signal peptidase
MAPKIPVESIVVIQKQNEYIKGDVITFKADADRKNLHPKITTTHRIESIEDKDGQKIFTTKGDANNAADTKTIDQGLIIGKVVAHIPFVGRIVALTKTQAGFIGLIVIPATIIIYSELMSIKEETKRLLKERKNRKLNLLEKAEVEIGETEMEIEKDIKKIIKKKKPAPKKKK